MGSMGFELTQPALIPHLRARLLAGGAMERLALEATLLGWNEAPSAGHLNERYVLRRVIEEGLLGEEHDVQWNARRLRFEVSQAGRKVVIASVDEGMQGSVVEVLPDPGNPDELKELLGELFNSFVGEKGIDGLVFARDPESDKTIHVNLIQVKTGRWGRKIATRDASAIISKAEKGWKKLTDRLGAVFGTRYTFSLGSFTLITNKTIEIPARALLESDSTLPGSKMILDQEDFKRDILDDDLKTRLGAA
jgi:hypothetical protein